MGANMIHFLKLLKDHNFSDARIINEDGDTALHLAIKNKTFTPKEMIQVIGILLDLGIDLNIKNNNKETILSLAITNRMTEVIDFLIKRKVKLDYLVADYLIRDEYTKFIELRDRQSLSNSEIQKVESESANFVEWMISRGLDIDGENVLGRSSVYSAIRFNLQHILPTLLKYANVIDFVDEHDIEGSLIHIFLLKNKSVRDYHELRPSKNWYRSYARRHAPSVVKMMLDKGISPDGVDTSGNTALHLAIDVKENLKIVNMLIENSKNVNQKNSADKTPLHIAFWKCIRSNQAEIDYYLTILRALIEKGVDVNKPDNIGYTLLSNALEKNNLRLIDFLQENEANFGGCKSLIHSLFERTKHNKNSSKAKEVDLLFKHWIKLDVANIKYITDSDYRVLAKSDVYLQYYKKCMNEIHTLKNTFIDSRTTLYNFLLMDPNRRCTYVNNEKLKKIVLIPNLKEIFPEYSVFIIDSYHQAQDRRSLLGPAKEAWFDLTEINLPDICIECIFSFLDDCDLSDMIERGKGIMSTVL